MTEQERQEIKASLIELGFWGAEEAGNPIADSRDALTLYTRAAERLAKGAGLYSTGLTAISRSRKIDRQPQHQDLSFAELPGLLESFGAQPRSVQE
jgi:hypothetical protein